MNKSSTSRDLLLLAAVAFQKQRFDKAGQLFAAALSSDDAVELLTELDVEGNLEAELASDWGTGLAGDAPRTNLSAIAKEIGDAMFMVSMSSDDDTESEDEVNVPDIEDEDEDSDTTSDDFGDIPGQMVIPSSLSASQHQGGGTVRKMKLVMDHTGPVRVK